MVNKYYGSCLCGRVSYEVSGDFDAFYLCHCSRCQKDTGSAHSAKIFVADCAAWSADLSGVPSYDALPGQEN